MANITPAALLAVKQGNLENFIAATTPGGIEAQEKSGQLKFAASQTLPKECPREQLENLGFVFGEDADDLFVNCVSPEGWSIRATDHSMHSELLDPQGRVRGSIFYKAAFYDRRAHMSLKTRYTAGCSPEDGYRTEISFAEREAGKWAGTVIDSANGEIVWKTEWEIHPDYQRQNALSSLAVEWMRENYPEYKDPLAYWD